LIDVTFVDSQNAYGIICNRIKRIIQLSQTVQQIGSFFDKLGVRDLLLSAQANGTDEQADYRVHSARQPLDDGLRAASAS